MPPTFSNLTLEQNGNELRLSWKQPEVTAEIVILANDHIGGRFKKLDTVEQSGYITQAQRPQPYEFVIAAKVGNNLGPYSNRVKVAVPAPKVPAVLEAEHFSDMQNALVLPMTAANHFVTGPLSGSGITRVQYSVQVDKAGIYSLSLNGSSASAIAFEVATDDSILGQLSLAEASSLEWYMKPGINHLSLTTAATGWQLDQITIMLRK